jgi:hypothetical protein
MGQIPSNSLRAPMLIILVWRLESGKLPHRRKSLSVEVKHLLFGKFDSKKMQKGPA